MATANPRSPAIGIDLGTTYSCVAVYQEEKVKILSNDNKKNITPSMVAFTPDGRIFGDDAKSYSTYCPEECIENVKRFIGRDMKDRYVLQDMKHLLFTIVTSGGTIKIRIRDQNGTKDLKPEEISGMVLGHMKTIAEKHLKCIITDAVITVPAYFTDAQRRATQDAGRIAGLNVLQILNEPTAAALAYGFQHLDSEQHKYFVYDLGGGTFDVSILSVEDGEFVVISTDGDPHLGGEDINNIMVKHMAREFQRTTGLDLHQDKRAIRRLKDACEKAKIQLSTELNSSIDLVALQGDEDFTYSVTRAWLEDVCEDLINKTRDIVIRALDHRETDPDSITEVILVGGSTRMPMVQGLMKEIFSGKEPRIDINPDEAVAYGAAIQAAILTGHPVRNIRLRDVTQMSLGIAVRGGIMAPVIKRNTPIPTQKGLTVSTSQDNQEFLSLEIYEGERRLVKGNNRLGVLTLTGIPPTPKGVPKIPVTFSVDKDGILHASAFDPAAERQTSLTLANRSNFSPESLRRAIKLASDMAQKDTANVQKIKARLKLEVYMNQVRDSIKNPKIRAKIDKESLDRLLDKMELTNAMIINESPRLSHEHYENSQNELEEVWKPISMSLYPQDRDDSFRPFATVDWNSNLRTMGTTESDGQYSNLGTEYHSGRQRNQGNESDV